jgi:hypothetical protein
VSTHIARLKCEQFSLAQLGDVTMPWDFQHGRAPQVRWVPYVSNGMQAASTFRHTPLAIHLDTHHFVINLLYRRAIHNADLATTPFFNSI